MKIFYASDTHAAESTFRKFTNAGPFYKADMVIYGGDFVGKAVVPIIKTSIPKSFLQVWEFLLVFNPYS